ncbi:hypothetical protein [Neptuniibacter halophilus]|uniref:hypothetical protein n=1 Tax=Neptuniibacter halophilus TaxID=651666 RepID=UPI0025736C43|nr:hypothetical protein [Neptuniibacter halophilus]
MGWGSAIGMGQAIQGIGQNVQDDLKQQRVQQWRQQEAQNDRQFRRELSDNEQARADERLDQEMQFKTEQSQLDRQSAEKIASMRTGVSGGKVGRFKPVTNDATGETRILDTMTGRYMDGGEGGEQAPFDPDAFIQKYQQSKASDGAAAPSEPGKHIPLSDQHQNEQSTQQAAQNNAKQIRYFDAQLANVANRVDDLAGLALPDNSGLFNSASAGTNDQNAKKHFMTMLEDIYRNGTDTQKQQAKALYSRLMGAN